MWIKKELKLLDDNGMSFVSKVFIWFIFWQFIFITVRILNYGLNVDIIESVVIDLLLIIGVVLTAKLRPGRYSTEIVRYIKALLSNKKAFTEYFLPDGLADSDDNKDKRIYPRE